MSKAPELIKKIIKNNQNIVSDIDKMLEKLMNIFNEKTEKYVSTIREKIKLFNSINGNMNISDSNLSSDSSFILINNIEKSIIIIDQVHDTLNKLLNKTQNSDTYLSQTFINETFNLHKNIVVTYKKTRNIVMQDKDELTKLFVEAEIKNPELASDTYKRCKYLQSLYIANPFAINLYSELMSKIVEMVPTWHPEKSQLAFSILTLIEDDKTRILNMNTKPTPLTVGKTKMLNPYYKTFRLIPVTKLMPIDSISKLIFNLPAKNMTEFVKICKSKEYGLIVIRKHITHPFTYNAVQLLDWKESQKFDQEYKSTYGVNISLLNRYNTIEKIDKKNKWDFSIDTYVFKFDNFENDKEKFIIILDSLSADMYRINVNYMSTNKFFIRVSSIKELYLYCKNNKDSALTRMGQYNSLCINNAKQNIFSPVKIDFDKLKVTASISDPKYLKNQIYLLMMEEFKSATNKKSIKNNYIYASIIHNEQFLNIFSDVLINEFHSYLYKTYDEYVTGNVQISEVTASFLNVIYIYQRTFVKEIHDYFKNNLLNFKTEEDIARKVSTHFDEMVKSVLEKIITTDSNIYQTVLYKINLLKNTLV
jgi:hypothetical protein